MQTNFYLSRLSDSDIARIGSVLPSIGNVSLDLGHSLALSLKREMGRRLHNDRKATSPIEPRPLTIKAGDWTDNQVCDALRAAASLAIWARVESEAVASFGDWVLLACVGYSVNRLADARHAEMALRVRECNRDTELVAIHDDAELAGMLQPIA